MEGLDDIMHTQPVLYARRKMIISFDFCAIISAVQKRFFLLCDESFQNADTVYRSRSLLRQKCATSMLLHAYKSPRHDSHAPRLLFAVDATFTITSRRQRGSAMGKYQCVTRGRDRFLMMSIIMPI